MTGMHERARDFGRGAADSVAHDRTWSEEMIGIRVRWNDLLGTIEAARRNVAAAEMRLLLEGARRARSTDPVSG